MKRSLPLLVLLTLIGACSDASGPEPVRSVDILLGAAPAGDQTIPVGGTVQLGASTKDESGQTLLGRPVSWRSTLPAVATVDSTGLVTGRAAGSTLVIAASEAAADTTRVTVTAPVAGVPICAEGDAGLTLQLGEVRTFSAAETGSLCLSGGVSGAEFTYIPFNATTTAGNLVLEILGGGVVPATGPPSPARIPSSDAQLDRGGEEEWAFHHRLRLYEREVLARGVSRGIAPLRSLSAAVPAVGDRLSLNGDPDVGCAAVDRRTATVEAVSDHAIVVSDSANTAGGLTRSDFESFAALFDRLIWPVVTRAMGTPTDIDSNDRIILFYTRAVNDLTPEDNGSFVGGFFHPRDLSPNTGVGSCAASNFGEVLYLLTPDSARAGLNEASPFSRTSVLESSPGVIGHELQHVINATSRVRRDVGVGEEVWLNEGLSHIAEELLFYAAAGIDSERNLDVAALRSSETIRLAFNSYQSSNFGRLRQYLNEPADQSLIGVQNDDDLPTRGASWAFLRYAADRKADTEAAKSAIWNALVNSSTAGLQNIERVLGIDGIQWMQDWTTSVYTDDSGLAVPVQYQQVSWNFREIFAVLSTSGRYPLRTLALPEGGRGVNIARLQGGGAAFIRFGIAGGGRAAVQATSGGAVPPDRLRISIVRTK